MIISFLYTDRLSSWTLKKFPDTKCSTENFLFFFYFRDLTTKLLTLEGRALVAFDEIVYEFLDAGDGASNEASEPD